MGVVKVIFCLGRQSPVAPALGAWTTAQGLEVAGKGEKELLQEEKSLAFSSLWYTMACVCFSNSWLWFWGDHNLDSFFSCHGRLIPHDSLPPERDVWLATWIQCLRPLYVTDTLPFSAITCAFSKGLGYNLEGNRRSIQGLQNLPITGDSISKVNKKIDSSSWIFKNEI